MSNGDIHREKCIICNGELEDDDIDVCDACFYGAIDQQNKESDDDPINDIFFDKGLEK